MQEHTALHNMVGHLGFIKKKGRTNETFLKLENLKVKEKSQGLEKIKT